MAAVLLQYPGIPGFLGTRGSLMLDVVFVAMLAVLPVMGLSIYLVKYRLKYQIHKTIQLVLATLLLLAVTAFELEIRIHGWTQRAQPSPYWVDDSGYHAIHYSLAVHLFFAIPTPFLWMYVIVQALRKFPRPPRPNAYSRQHVLWARIAALAMVMTAVTGWVFYWLAFVAT